MKIIPVAIAVLALAACAQTQKTGVSYGNDMLPSAEVTAFEQTHARLKYAGAKIEHDTNGCAVYEGVAPDGKVRREPLLDASKQPICVRR
ncbi:hypothetical protein [Xylophilus sp. ASV27]|uniref:hypothetical protein n=1 Tax=Xylophilus sp. ASV27 TaxID=2795129 RepID=UPI0018ED9097|nr:hypothetical protein [Xylophilus sp. ASV27]